MNNNWNPAQFIHEFTTDNLVTWKYGKVIYLFFNISLVALLSTHITGVDSSSSSFVR